MFSIESTIDEIILFVKRFFNTLIYTFLHPRSLLTSKLPLNLLKPSHYLLICMLVFFGLQTLNSWYVHAISLNKTVKSYLAYYDKNSIEANLLYIIPIATSVWGFVTLVAKLLRLSNTQTQHFKAYLFCWMGNCLLLIAVYVASTVVTPNMSIIVNGPPDRWFDIIQNIISYSYYLLWYGPFVLTVLVLVLNFKKIPRPLIYKYLSVPVFLWLTANFCVKGANFIRGFFDEKNELLGFYDGSGSNSLFSVDGTINDAKSDTIKLRMTAVIKNTSDADIYFQKDFFLTLTAGDEPGNTGDPTTAMFYINQVDDLPPKSIMILKPGDSKSFQFAGKVLAKEWPTWLAKANVTPGGWCDANYNISIDSPDLSGVGAGGKIKVAYRVDTLNKL